MRQKRESVLSVRWNDEGLPLPVRVYRAKYQAIGQVLDRSPDILDRIHNDLRKLSQGGRRGREGDYTSENILRALVVQSIEGLSFRDVVVRIAESEFLQDFLRMRKKTVMDYSFLNKCFKAIRPETWKAVNELLGQDAVQRDLIDPATIRTDTTVVETNIHYPTDSSLLWDTWRVASRWLRRAREIELAKWQAFRAGIEGTISGLKRVFRLFRCFFRGFKSFASAVGLGVFCHNLIVLAGSS